MANRPRHYRTTGPLKGGIGNYTGDAAKEAFTPAQARAEYARLRREANRRIEVLKRSRYANLPSVRNRPDSYPELYKGASDETAYKMLGKVAEFLNLKTSSLKGARAATWAALDTLKSQTAIRINKKGQEVEYHPYAFLNRSNILDFQEYMGEVSDHKLQKGYSYDDILDMFKLAQDKKIDAKDIASNFKFWLEHRKELNDAPAAAETISGASFASQMGW